MRAKFFSLLISFTVILTLGCGGDDSVTLEGPSLSTGRWAHTATVLQDGRLLVVGGQESMSRASKVAEIFDPSTDTWSNTGETLDKRGEGHTATLLNDGRVLVTGDNEEGSSEIYDPSTDQWSYTGTMNVARKSASATLLEDGRVLVSGGVDRTKAGRVELDSSEIYDPSSGEWTVADVMEQIHSNHVTRLVDGKVFLSGWFLSEMYDPATDLWSPVGEPKRKDIARGTTATILNDGTVLMVGGARFPPNKWQGDPSHPVGSSEIYNPSDGSLSTSVSMATPREYHSAILLKNGDVLIVGGISMESYNPGAKIWTEIGELIHERDQMHTATMLNDGRIVIAGGRMETDDKKIRSLSAVEIYDPSALKE